MFFPWHVILLYFHNIDLVLFFYNNYYKIWLYFGHVSQFSHVCIIMRNVKLNICRHHPAEIHVRTLMCQAVRLDMCWFGVNQFPCFCFVFSILIHILFYLFHIKANVGLKKSEISNKTDGNVAVKVFTVQQLWGILTYPWGLVTEGHMCF